MLSTSLSIKTFYLVYFQSLDTSDLKDVGVIQKPDFVAHPERYFSQSLGGKQQNPTVLPPIPTVTDSKSLLLPTVKGDKLSLASVSKCYHIRQDSVIQNLVLCKKVLIAHTFICYWLQEEIFQVK